MKNVLAIVGILALILLAVFVTRDKNKNEVGRLQTAVTAVDGYTMNDVAKHNNKNDCWIAANGKVYDLTAWLDDHEGGPEKIIMLCGGDATVLFDKQHGENEEALEMLDRLEIGNLVN